MGGRVFNDCSPGATETSSWKCTHVDTSNQDALSGALASGSDQRMRSCEGSGPDAADVVALAEKKHLRFRL